MMPSHNYSLSTPPSALFSPLIGPPTIPMIVVPRLPSPKAKKDSVKRANTITSTSTTMATTNIRRRGSLQSPMSCPHLALAYQAHGHINAHAHEQSMPAEGLPRPLHSFTPSPTTKVECGFLLTREQCAWGVEAVCTEICRRDPSPSQHAQSPPSPMIHLLTIFSDLFPLQTDTSLPRRFDSLTSNSRSGQSQTSSPNLPTSIANEDLSFSYTVTVSKTSHLATSISPQRQPSLRHNLLSPFRSSHSSAARATTPLTPEVTADILCPLTMKDLFDLLVLLISKGLPESFTPSYSSDFSSLIQPYGKSYQDLLNHWPCRNRDLLTRIIVAARHWARCEAVDVVGKRRRHSIDSCSRDDLSLSGFGDLLSPQLPPLEDPNRVSLQKLASTLFCRDQPKGYISEHHGGVQDMYMADYRFPQSSRDRVQSIRSFEPEVSERDALEALENLMLLHESLDQLESWKKFLDSHTALSLPPWQTGVKKDIVTVVVSQAPKALLRRTLRGRTESAPTKVRVSGQAHNVSALIPTAPARQALTCTSDKILPTLLENEPSPSSGDGRYNYKTSYWQYKCRQNRARHDNAPDHHSPHKEAPSDSAESLSLPTHPFDLASGTLGLVEDTTTPPIKADSAGLNSSTVVSTVYSQPSTPVPTPQVQPVEFIAPPMKDLYSAPIIMEPIRPSERSNSQALSDTAPSSTKRPITAAIDVAAIKAAKKRPSPIILTSAPLSISKSTATTSVSPTTAEYLITNMSTQNPGYQDDIECQTAKKGWRIWNKPLMHLKRKSLPSLPALPSLSLSSAPPVPTLNRAELTTTASWTSSPITVPVITSSKLSPGGTPENVSRPKKSFKRPVLSFKNHSQNDAACPSQSPRLNLDILYNDSTGTPSPSSTYSFSSRDGSVRATSSPSLGCSIASIPFPDDYMSIDPNSAIWSSPSAQTPPPQFSPAFPSPSVVDSFPKVTFIPPLPPSPTVSAISRTRRLQEKLFGKKSKKSLSSIDDFCASSTLTSTSSSMSLNRTNVLHGGVAGFTVTSISSTGAEFDQGTVEPPVLKNTSSLGSLREKASLGHLLASQILKTGSIRSVGTVAATAAVAAATVARGGQDSKDDSRFQFHEHRHNHDRLRPVGTHMTTTPTRTSSKSSSTSTNSSSPSSSPSLPKASRMIVEYHHHHQQLRQQPHPGSTHSSGEGNGGGVVSVAIVEQTSERDEKEANDQIWRVIDQWRARKDAHAKSS